MFVWKTQAKISSIYLNYMEYLERLDSSALDNKGMTLVYNGLYFGLI